MAYWCNSQYTMKRAILRRKDVASSDTKFKIAVTIELLASLLLSPASSMTSKAGNAIFSKDIFLRVCVLFGELFQHNRPQQAKAMDQRSTCALAFCNREEHDGDPAGFHMLSTSHRKSTS